MSLPSHLGHEDLIHLHGQEQHQREKKQDLDRGDKERQEEERSDAKRTSRQRDTHNHSPHLPPQSQSHPVTQDNDNIIRISPRLSPVLSGGRSPGSSPTMNGMNGRPVGSPPFLDLALPRFSLTKRSSVSASLVSSHFALGPDHPESKGFLGRGRGKILMAIQQQQPLTPTQLPPISLP